MIYSCRFPLMEMGDITLGWDTDQVEMMTEIITRKMAEGFTFFVLDDDGRQLRMRSIDDLKGRMSVIIGDKEAELLIKQGKIGIVDVSDMIEDQPTPKARRAKSAREAATGHAVATRRMGGG